MARGLWRVPASVGRPVRLTALRPGERTHLWPHVLPNGKGVIYTVWNNRGFDGGSIAVQPFDEGAPTILGEGGGYGRVVASDGGRAYLVCARLEGLTAAPFDLGTLRIAGPSRPVLDGVLTNGSSAQRHEADIGALGALVCDQTEMRASGRLRRVSCDQERGLWARCAASVVMSSELRVVRSELADGRPRETRDSDFRTQF